MAIVETKKFIRPNTSVSFYSVNGTETTNLNQVHNAMEALKSSNRLSGPGSSLSDDQLTLTHAVTYADLDVWSQRDTALSIALDAEYMQYNQEHGITSGNPQYTVTGIDSPFTCTTVYTFQAGNTSLLDVISNAASADSEPSSSKLTSLTATDTTLTLVHQYNNSDDFTVNHFSDIQGVVELNAAGVTRNITYAAV